MSVSFVAKQKNHWKSVSQRELFIIFCFLAAAIVGWLFPAKSVGDMFWVSIFLFFVFPFLVVKFILKEPLKDFGLSEGNRKKGMASAALFAIAATLAMGFLIQIPKMKGQISLLPGIAGSFPYFLGTELFVVPAIFLSREFFFRGFFQFGLEKRLGNAVIVLQAVLFSLLFIRSSWLEFGYAFFSSLAAGSIAKHSRSVYYSFAALWIISLVIDILVIRMASRGM
jgi:membrane protease YdiL (CAAX protease family)